jgi:hypothetical protein
VIGFTRIDPIKALYWSAVINGVVSVPVMGLIMFTAVNPRIMGKFIIPVRHRITRWAATIAMALPRSPFSGSCSLLECVSSAGGTSLDLCFIPNSPFQCPPLMESVLERKARKSPLRKRTLDTRPRRKHSTTEEKMMNSERARNR